MEKNMKYILFALALSACGGNSESVIVDEYVECKDFCNPQGVRDFIKGDSGYTCACNITRKD
jgi:hypothetical protein